MTLSLDRRQALMGLAAAFALQGPAHAADALSLARLSRFPLMASWRAPLRWP